MKKWKKYNIVNKTVVKYDKWYKIYSNLQ